MLDLVLALIVAVMLVAGGIFVFLAALGIVRLPDVYTRMHAASKAGTVGSGLMLFAVAAHLLARAAHKAGYRLARISTVDEMRDAERREAKKR